MSVYDYNRTYADVTQGFVAESTHVFRASFERIKHCVGQLSDEQLWWRPRPEMNSIANLMFHLSGNVGQWVISPDPNPPTTPNRPGEFAQRDPIPRAQLLGVLEDAVRRACTSIESIKTSAQLLQLR